MNQVCFETLTGELIALAVARATRRVVYAAPGIDTLVADAIVDARRRLGLSSITVVLDGSEEARRLGYGAVEAVRALLNTGTPIGDVPGLRAGVLVCDDEVWCFTPPVLCVEAVRQSSNASNAIRLGPSLGEQVASAAMEEKSGTEPLTEAKLSTVEARLKESPPARFDLQRLVRVYQAYVQYVEIALVGCSIARKTVTLPNELLNLAPSDDELDRRLRTSFKLLESSNAKVEAEMGQFERQVADLRKHYTRSLKDFGGSMILKEKRAEFDRRVSELKSELTSKRECLLKLLTDEITDTRKRIAKLLVPRLVEEPPQSLTSSVPAPLTKESAERWLTRRLDRCVPVPKKILDGMRLDCVFKDLTFETLNMEEFVQALQRAWPDYPWDKPMYEYRAAREAGQAGMRQAESVD